MLNCQKFEMEEKQRCMKEFFRRNGIVFKQSIGPETQWHFFVNKGAKYKYLSHNIDLNLTRRSYFRPIQFTIWPKMVF